VLLRQCPIDPGNQRPFGHGFLSFVHVITFRMRVLCRNTNRTPRAIGILFSKVRWPMQMIAISGERVAVGVGVSGRDAGLWAMRKTIHC
jgi:hypothetical protein